MITKYKRRKKEKKKEKRVQFCLKLLYWSHTQVKLLDGNGVGDDLQQKKKIVGKLPNNDHETSLKIIVLRGPFKRKNGSEDVKSNFSSVFAQNCETRHDNAPFT